MKAYELLEKPESWTQGYYARTAINYMVYPANDSDAAKWCTMGAVQKCYGYTGITHDLIKRIEDRIGRSVAAWNDATERTHSEVVALLKELDI